MQRYAEQLILFSEAQERGNLSDAMDERADGNGVTTVAHMAAPSRPMLNMGAIDAFGGQVAADSDNDAPRNNTPRTVASAATFLATTISTGKVDLPEGNIFLSCLALSSLLTQAMKREGMVSSGAPTGVDVPDVCDSHFGCS